MAIEVLRLSRGKGNAIDDGFLEELVRRLDGLEDADGVVLTGDGKFFSAGLALPVVYGFDRAAMNAFMRRFGEAMLRVFTFPRPIVAALNGHAVAGGCVLALQCDVRIAADGMQQIGLNEAAIGIGLPTLVLETLRHQVPPASVLPIALEGRLFVPQRALELGLIDEVVPAARLEERALARARELAAIPRAAFAHVKRALRRPVVEIVERHAADDGERWLETWFSKEARERIGAAVKRLGGTG